MGQARATFYSYFQLVVWLLLALAASCIWGPARALEPAANEDAKIKSCEREICGMILSPNPKGRDLSCDLTKTWSQEALEKGAEKWVSWTYGDARCSAKVALKRADIIGALTAPKYEILLPEQPVTCLIQKEGSPATSVVMTLAPKLTFKAGAADKVWINLKGVEGPKEAKRLVASVAKLEDTLGIFHKPMIKAVNRFIAEQCPAKYGAKPEKFAEKKTPSAP